MRVAQIWTYPVKSMIGQTVDEAQLGPTGIVGDRIWACRDLERGGIRGAKQLGGLMQFAASALGHGHVRITCPDGTAVSTADPDVDERVSAALGHPVRLEALPDAGDLDHFRRGRPDHDDLMDELRAVFGREPDEPLPDFSVFPPEIAEFETPPGTYYDVFPLMVMTTAALRALTEALEGSAVDVRRFRPSLVIDTDDEPGLPTSGHPEFEWKGRIGTLGGAQIRFLDPCPRCVMVTRMIDEDVPADRAILRHIVRDLGQNLGVYAEVVSPGPIRIGDELTLG
jgi:uncharacterized protein